MVGVFELTTKNVFNRCSVAKKGAFETKTKYLVRTGLNRKSDK